MKSQYTRFAAFTVLALVVFTNCQQPNTWEHEFQTILEDIKRLDQSYSNLNGRVDSLWDATTAHLQETMPAGMPPIEADIFLKSRNADHMRMFMSFQLLDTVTQTMVNQAGEMDSQLAKQIQEVQQGRNSIENKKLEFLKKVKAADEERYEMFHQKFVAAAMASQE